MMRPPRTWPNFPFPVFCISCVAWERRHPCVCVRPGRTNPQPRPCVHIRMGINVPMPQAAHLVHACACGVLAHGRGVGTWNTLPCVCVQDARFRSQDAALTFMNRSTFKSEKVVHSNNG